MKQFSKVVEILKHFQILQLYLNFWQGTVYKSCFLVLLHKISSKESWLQACLTVVLQFISQLMISRGGTKPLLK